MEGSQSVRNKQEYPGQEVYPVEERHVYRLTNPRRRKNHYLNATVDHTVYIWVQRFGKQPRSRQPKDRMVRIMTVLIPDLRGFEDKSIIESKYVQKDSIVRALKDGYDVISTNTLFNYTRWAYENFYKLIGLLR